MTKDELLRRLASFTDELQIYVQDGTDTLALDHLEYGIDPERGGYVILLPVADDDD